MAILFGAFGACTASAQMPKLDDLMKEAGKLTKPPTDGTKAGTSPALLLFRPEHAGHFHGGG